MERNCSFQRLVGGQCGQDPRSTKVQDLVPLLTCNKDISRHKSSLGLMTGSGVDTEVELILARSSIFSFPSNISDMDICPAHSCSLGIGWRRGLARCRIYTSLCGRRTKGREVEVEFEREARSLGARTSAQRSRFALAFNFPSPSPLYAGHAGYIYTSPAVEARPQLIPYYGSWNK